MDCIDVHKECDVGGRTKVDGQRPRRIVSMSIRSVMLEEGRR